MPALSASLGLNDMVIYTGHVTDTNLLDGLYTRADLLVFPSLYDNAPMVVREAAALGTPSLLARVPVPPRWCMMDRMVFWPTILLQIWRSG